MLSGCATARHPIASLKPRYHPDNVFCYSPVLPADIKRVAVLPLFCTTDRPDLEDGCEILNPILQAELIKTKRFEVIPVNRQTLRNCTGRAGWAGTEALPRDFFSSLRQVYGCDAVLFSQLTVFRPYAPLAVGWRMKLVDARTHRTLWAADELFDAGQLLVQNGASHYQWTQQSTPNDQSDNWLVQNSPRRFGQYTAAQVVATLPKR